MFRIICDPSSGIIELYWLKIFIVVHRCLSCAWSVFGSVIFEPVVCVYRTTGWELHTTTVHTHHWFKITLPNTDQAHDKHL